MNMDVGGGGGGGGPTGPRGVLAGFVSTSVLTSSDGLFGDHVEETRISEAPAPRPEDASDFRPLYERLQEMKDKKDSEWKEKNNPFAPPKALDDEEIAFIHDLEGRKADTERRRKEQHEQDLATFLLARGTAKPATDNGTIGAVGVLAGQAKRDDKAKPLAAKAKAPSVVVVRAKRKPGDEAAKKKKSKVAKVETKAPTELSKSTDKTVESADSEGQPHKAASAAKAAAPALGLVAYSSDSD